MMTEQELKTINGGGINIGFGILLGGLATFIIGLVDGYIRPLACH